MKALNADQLARYGITGVVEIDGYETRTSNASRPFTPVGFMVHHTAGRDSLGLCIRRKLVQYHLDKKGTITLIASGRAGHCGYGAQSVIDDCRNDIAPKGDASKYSSRAVDPYRHLDPEGSRVPGYQWFIGVEVENLGDGSDPYPDEQIEAMVKLAAAHCVEYEWSANRVIHHREFTSRKIDMSWYGDLRGEVNKAMEQMVASSQTERDPMSGIFSDVPKGSYFEKAAEWAFKNGITKGIGPGKFGPDEPMTRAQAVTFLHRYHEKFGK